MYRSRYYLRLGWRLLNLNVIGFTVAMRFGVVQIGIIFSSLVVDPLPDKSVTFVHQEQNHQPKLDWLFSLHRYQLELLCKLQYKSSNL
jgi:hypothetical protein